MAGQLTTHCLDIVLGQGAAGLAVTVVRLEPAIEDLGRTVLDDGGRAVLVSGEAFAPGVYELVFKVGAYQRAKGLAQADPPFLEDVPVRFGVSDASRHCHVPLLISLYGYSTYRGG
jgi:5-hydroxyisourate hydrolase